MCSFGRMIGDRSWIKVTLFVCFGVRKGPMWAGSRTMSGWSFFMILGIEMNLLYASGVFLVMW